MCVPYGTHLAPSLRARRPGRPDRGPDQLALAPGEADGAADGVADPPAGLPLGDAAGLPLASGEALGDGGVHCGSGFVRSPQIL